MSSIDKMLIKGVRSFSPENKVVIEFYKPLTLIVGHNGAGKTTVIECLKMACTGELPPHSDQGKSFVHDPKVAGETEVKGQIKLRFYNASHIPFIVMRSFQVTQKNALSFKTLDSTVQTLDPDGNMTALPGRCADVNNTVPYFMGVSKAILDNVIFVHQEDSSWPLAEKQVLKKKFDDIFAATKYTKALDDLRKLRVKQTGEAKIMKEQLETLKAYKDHAAKLRTAVAEGEARAAALQREIEELTVKIDEIAAKRREVDTKLVDMADQGDDLVSTKARYDLLVRKNAESYARLVGMYPAEDMNMSEEELKECKTDFDANTASAKAELQSKERELQAAKMQAAALRDQVEREARAISKLQAEADQHVRNIEDRDRFLRQICVDVGGVLPMEAMDETARLSTDTIKALQAIFKEKMDAARGAVDAAKQRHRTADDAAARSIDQVLSQISGAAETLRMKKESVRANEAKLKQIQAQLDAEAGANRGALDAAQARVNAKTKDLEERESELAGSSLEDESRRLAEEMAGLAGKADRLRQERKVLAAAAEETSRMNYKAQELEAATRKLDEQLDRHRYKLMLTLDAAAEDLPPPGPALVAAVRAATEQRRQQYEAAAAALKNAQSRKSATEGTLHATISQLNKLNAELSQLSQQLEAGVGSGQSVGQTLEGLAKEQKDKDLMVNRSEVFEHVIKNYIHMARSKNVCVTCSRPFSTEAQRSSFIDSKQQELSNIPSQAERVKNELKELEQKMQALKALEPVAVRHDTLRYTEVPALQARVAELEKEVASLQDAVDDAAREEESAGTALQEAQDALQDGALVLARLAMEAAERKSEVDALQATVRTSDASRSVSTVDAELAELEARRAEVERAKEAASSKLSKLRDVIAALRSEIHRERENVLRLTAAVEKRATLETQKSELLTLNQKLSGDLIEARKVSAPLEQRRDELQRQREEARAAARAEEAELEGTLQKLHRKETQLEARERALREYEQRGGQASLEKAEGKLAGIQELHMKEETKVEQLIEKVNSDKTAIHDSDKFIRQVEDLLAYHRSKNEENELAAELDQSRARLAAAGDRASLENESRALEAKERELRSEADRAAGALSTVQENVALAATDLEAPEYEDIDDKHRRKLIEMRTTEMASNDLEKFHKALERALLSFHNTKMADINKTIKELWQKTYRNSDIDYIQIRADTSSGRANRSYDYRVVMVCGGTELDMRGRCSAGQRVLACLVIRLALAESFCLNCGILALDEPTTNLDSENSASLAEALKALMLARRDQENFQLVVITHDEVFARHIGTREHAEHMWRIVKDENQHSQVTKEDIWE